MTHHHIGHTAHDHHSRAIVQCTCGAILGKTKREKFPLGGYSYHATTAKGKSLGAASRMSLILQLFAVEFPEHVGER